MILALRTDNPLAELYLCQKLDVISELKWEAHRQLADTIHTKIEDICKKNTIEWDAITGIVVFKGPGSFTGLRIGISVANTIAYTQSIPIVGSVGDNWLQDGLKLISLGENQKIILPEYGGGANITAPKK